MIKKKNKKKRKGKKYIGEDGENRRVIIGDIKDNESKDGKKNNKNKIEEINEK